MNEKSPQRTWDDKVNLCKQWQQSDLSLKKFCEQQNIAVATFSGWCSRFWPSRQKSPAKLCPVQIVSPTEATKPAEPAAIVIELSLPHAVTARFKATNGQIRVLLQELLYATTTLR